ncbi:ribonucleases P/MRP protein subunit POP1 [Erpetoichthys calabaricus]|uniref:POP1 homolog, ribonuclease P/MRP subunit n=1 Tax=Erpetoichthys calabaricus TaxID=27687 RepID=A0A8C4SMU7_ERPCA|nr:ribonucleases P/MRP protein subunit POP1 [Erpetoichthys calabaricus]XP_028673136.1 ribonucleases P/MRP protein subunit POP1 [Erpetoichthys calabaricus]
MSGAKGRKYEKKMKHQPTSVTFHTGDPGVSSSKNYNGAGAQQQERKYGGIQPQRDQPWTPSSSFKHYHEQSHYRDGQTSQGFPKYITATTFAQARAAEVKAMLKAVSNKNSNSQVFQALPKHMRRRAMSSNVKRIPRRLRAIAKRELEKASQQKKEQSKNKSRKARRRHGNLLLEFNRRQRKNLWLETHIWHAKRFHMVKKWGYCLGDKPTSKCYRACYRAMTKHCLLQDLSYYCCLELTGGENELLKALARLTNRETGLTFAAVGCLSGKKQGSLVLYKAEKYPLEPLGPVTFLWKPKKMSEDRQLWIWFHPALKQDLIPQLKTVCQCGEPVVQSIPLPEPSTVVSTVEEMPEPVSVGSKRKRKDGTPLEEITVKKFIREKTSPTLIPACWKSQTTGIVLRDLTLEILRYRLIGPLSHSVLSDALYPASLCKIFHSQHEKHCSWWPEYCNEDNLFLHERQQNLFQLLRGIASPAEISAGTVLGLVVDDPRLTLPRKRTKSMPNLSMLPDFEKVRQLTVEGITDETSASPIWDQAVRDDVTRSKISEQELNRMKMEILVPGSRLDLGAKESKIPILLIHQSGKLTGQECLGWGSGWDILIPKGWGMAFWISLIYRGARAGGLQEGLKHSQHKGTAHFPDDFPDCAAGMRFSGEQKKELLDKYKRRPPSKRPNYIKHGSVAPFLCPWQQLVEEWEMILKIEDERGVPEECRGALPAPESSGEQMSKGVKVKCADEEMKGSPGAADFSILRNRTVLKQISAWCLPTSGKGKRANCPASFSRQQIPSGAALLISAHNPRCLVWTRLSLLKKGSPTSHALICIPDPGDIQMLCADLTFCGPQEPKHKDHFKKKIKELKKKKLASSPGASCKVQGIGCSELPSKLISGLWPEPLPSITSHCTRVTIGFVLRGDFSLTAGCGEALGLVSVAGLLHMLSQQSSDRKGLVLVRNPASLQYRFARIMVEV